MAGDDHVALNRVAWDAQAPRYAEVADAQWAAEEVTWGLWHVPESEVGMLPAVAGLDCVELGCGTGYVSAWLARRGARTVVGLDNSPAQLATARRLRDEHGLAVSFVHGDAEQVPLRSGSFDLAVSEYGAAIWCDPYRWIPEAARLLRPGGRLAFLGNATLLMLLVDELDGVPAHTCLQRPQRGMHRFEWTEDEQPSVEFHVSHGDRIRLLRESGFEVLELVELYPPDGATTSYPYVTPEWARQWPSEEVWVAERRGPPADPRR